MRIKNKTGSGSDKESSTERAFMAFKHFKGKCNKCGRIGYKAADCQSGGAGGTRHNDDNDNVHEGNGGRVNQDADHECLCKENHCSYCKRKGHIARYCRAKEEEKLE